MPKHRIRAHHAHTADLEIRTEGLPPGVCGQISGVALTYNQRDAYDTTFEPGCLDKTRSEKLAAGKIRLMADHMGTTNRHVGVVRQMPDAGDMVMLQADLFDTDAGRSMLEYCKAVRAAGASTGLSIGFWDRAGEWKTDPGTNDRYYAYSEIELDEVSVTPMPAVPGAEMLAARHEQNPELLRKAFDAIADAVDSETLRAWVAARDSGNTDETPDSAHAADADSRNADSSERQATMDERLAVLRRSYASHGH